MSRPSLSPVRHARHTYGRRRDRSPADISFDAANSSVDSREQDHDSSFSQSAFEIPDPSSDVETCDTSPTSEDAPRAGTGNASDEGDSDQDDSNNGLSKGKHRYSWQDALDSIDNGELDPEEYLSKTKPHTILMGGSTRPASPSDPDHSATQPFSGSLSSLTPSPPVSSRTGALRRSRSPSFSDAEPRTRPSTPDSSPQHPIGTPRSHSSPTPPTSIEMPPKKGKGKEKAVEPLRFDKASKTQSTKPTRKKAVDSKRVKVRKAQLGSTHYTSDTHPWCTPRHRLRKNAKS